MGFLGVPRTFAPRGSPAIPEKRSRKEPLGAPCPARCFADTGPWGSRLLEGSPGCASQHHATTGSSQIVRIPPLISRLPTPLLSAPRRSWGLFSPLPSPVLLKLLHKSWRKQRLGWTPVRGSKMIWANMPLLKIILFFQLTKLLNQSNLLLPDHIAEAGV